MLWLVLGASLSTGAQLWEENLLCLLSTLPFGHCGEQYFPVYDQLEVIALGSCHFSWDYSPPLQCTRFHPSLTLSTDVLRVFPVLSSQYQHQPLGVITSTDHPLAGLRTTNHHALRPLFHPIFCPPHALINPMSLHLGQKTFMEGSIHDLTLKKGKQHPLSFPCPHGPLFHCGKWSGQLWFSFGRPFMGFHGLKLFCMGLDP